jgi:predicted ATPase/DNA-binding CsgD family transcriptional regulator
MDDRCRCGTVRGGMARLPEGAITFMLTDLKGSTRAWNRKPKAMRTAMERRNAILANTVRNHAGALAETGRDGDTVLAAFRTAGAAAACALDLQGMFATESWPEGLELKVRVALHTGEGQLRQGRYVGAALNLCAGLLATCHHGQILLTKATGAMLAGDVPVGSTLEDLGVRRIRDLTRPEQVFQLTGPTRRSEFPPLRSLPQLPTNLPRYLTTFVGRAAELAALKSSLAKSRLVTLTGAGGSGKTRLAAELGRACLGRLPGGVWWVDLAPIDDARQMPGAVVAALQLPGRGPAQEVATAWLAARKTMLILDNCEHLVAACAEFCQAALERCPELTIIATSREALRLHAEARWPVSSMPATDAVKLFEARAQLVVPNYTVTASNLATVSQICARLDGMPLAIELAAARLDIMTEHEILSQLSDRFRLLTGGARIVPERQKTMVATIDWSYRLLADDEVRLFRRLAVFRGGFTLESAQAVCADVITAPVLDVLAGLVQKSMVVAERTEGGRSRYRLLESHLEYAENRLRESGELEGTRSRHYKYFLDALAARPGITHPMVSPTQELDKADWMAKESGNLWAALGWARNNADDRGLGLAVNFVPSDFTQARRLLEDLLEHSPLKGTVRVLALCRATYLAGAQGDYGAALHAAEGAVAHAREVGHVEWLAWALDRLGQTHQVRGELVAAAQIHEEAASLLKGSTNLRLLRATNASRVSLAIESGDLIGASAVLVGWVATDRTEGNVMGAAIHLDSLARAQLGMKDHQAAVDSWQEALSIWRRFNDFFGILKALSGMASAACAGGDDHRALRLAASASRLSRGSSLQLEPWPHRRLEAAEQLSRSRLGILESEQVWSEGWEMTLDQAIDYALAESDPEMAVDAGPLSLREREVAALVAAGMTNRQIAMRLFISERTAEGHVEHIRNKLGVRSRTEIATWAVARGLARAPNR